MTAENDKVVSINYTLKNEAGETLDTSVGASPLEYVQGRGYLLPKLEEYVLGKNPGDKFSCTIEAKDGYGEYNEKLVVEVPRSEFEEGLPIEVGMAFQAMTESGPQIVIVKSVSDTTVTVDANHELAGKTLYFDIEILDVRDATEAELSSGMVGGGSSCGCGGCGGSCGDGGCGDGGCGGGCGSCGC